MQMIKQIYKHMIYYPWC